MKNPSAYAARLASSRQALSTPAEVAAFDAAVEATLDTLGKDNRNFGKYVAPSIRQIAGIPAPATVTVTTTNA